MKYNSNTNMKTSTHIVMVWYNNIVAFVVFFDIFLLNFEIY